MVTGPITVVTGTAGPQPRRGQSVAAGGPGGVGETGDEGRRADGRRTRAGTGRFRWDGLQETSGASQALPVAAAVTPQEQLLHPRGLCAKEKRGDHLRRPTPPHRSRPRTRHVAVGLGVGFPGRGKRRHGPERGCARRNCTVFCRISAFSTLGFRRRWRGGRGERERERDTGREGGMTDVTRTVTPGGRWRPRCRDGATIGPRRRPQGAVSKPRGRGG